MRKIILSVFLIALPLFIFSQKKNVMLDISHEQRSQYLKVNPQIFDVYKEVVEDQLRAALIINEDKELESSLLNSQDLVIILSPLSKETLKNLTTTERKSLVDYVKNGGKLILFTDEEHRMDAEAFGANEVVGPFNMQFGEDLDYIRNVMAISFIGEVFKGRYEVPYSGSRELTGGIPLSVRNSPGAHVHGAYTKLDNGGKIVVFGETMVALFLGGVDERRSDATIHWDGKDDKQFMLELIDWMLK